VSIYTKHINAKKTPQSEPALGKPQVENNAGGFVFQLTPMQQLRRFLILGTEGGTYYAKEKPLTKENCENVIKCIQSDGKKVVDEILSVSTEGRAVKNSPAIFALALCTAFGDEGTKRSAYEAIRRVCRTGTHLFEFCQAIQNLRGWSRGLRTGVGEYYNTRSRSECAYQIIKYRQRNGWTHRDVIRLAHVTSARHLNAPYLNDILRYAVGKATEVPKEFEAFESAQKLTKDNEKEAVKLITDSKLPWEALPTELLKSKKVWEALVPHVGLTALIRNLGKISSIGLTQNNLDEATKTVRARITDQEALIKGRIHPLTILNALRTYAQGRGDKGSLTWTPVQGIVDSLNDAFYMAFKAVKPTGQNWFLALDVSGSMDGSKIAGMNLSAREASCAMAMITAVTEPNNAMMAFSHHSVDLTISPKTRLDDIINKTRGMPFEGTDCSIPMLVAMKHNMPIDNFVIYTDSETWAGNIHPFQALKQYRQKSGRNAKLIVVGMCSNGFTIADPSDAGMMDLVGFDTSSPQAMSEFALELSTGERK